MISRKLLPVIPLVLLLALFAGVRPAAADSSHARIIRLSLVQGDVRFARQTHGDPLADANAVWETAELNLPIEQGYVLATDSGRAEVEFENGAMAFLRENTALQFYDLSLQDGMFTTRLVVLQGSASFYVNPARGDYFSVTGGDFTVEANSRASFRLDNYDNGSTVDNQRGHLTVLHGTQTTLLEKGQSFSMHAGDATSASVGPVADEDEFDRWVSGRVDTVSSATNQTLQYTSSPYYAPGFGSLYSYGSWFSCGGYGYGWRPFGAGLGWSPYTGGQWVLDPAFGWTWVSYQPWGWAPYHYGGWLFDSGCGGWFYSPPAYYNFPNGPIRRFPRRVNPVRPLVYHAVTAVFVRNNGKLGLIPMHPLDEKGKAPLNMPHGVFNPLGSKEVNEHLIATLPGQKWETLKSPPRDAFANALAPTSAPLRVSRTVLEGASGSRVISMGKGSSIAYDPREHRFVNSNNAPAAATAARSEKEVLTERNKTVPPATVESARTSAARTTTTTVRSLPPPRVAVPPPAPRYSASGERASSAGSHSSGSASAGHSPAPSAHVSSGGRPH